MRVAIFSPFPLGRTTTGGESRVNYFAEALSRNGVEVHVFARKKADNMSICKDVHFHKSSWLEELQPESISVSSIARITGACLKNLRRLLEPHSFDLVQAAGMTVALQSLLFSRLHGTPCVLDEPDVEFEKAREKSASGPWGRVLFAEKTFSRKATLVLTSSSREKEMMVNCFDLTESRISIVPNGVDTSRFSPSTTGADFRADLGTAKRPTVLFMGNYDYFPNKDSLRVIIEELVPRVIEAIPDALFLAIGKGLDPSQVKDKNLHAVGYVDDPRPYIQAADVCIAPIRYGGGTRIKILEYMSMGKPVVSTRKGAEGLEIAPERDIMIRDEPGAFALGIIELLRNKNLSDQIGHEARLTVKKYYEWSEIAARLIPLYKTLLN